MPVNIPNKELSTNIEENKDVGALEENSIEKTIKRGRKTVATYDESDNDLMEEYTDKRSITISLVHNYSNYRKVNMKTLGHKKETIGSSVSSCRILSSNRGEVEAYMPSLIGLSPNNPDFITRVKAWFSNIQFTVSNNDATLDISFIYNTKKDYLAFKEKEDTIDKSYAQVDRTNVSAIKEALKKKIEDLNTLESNKYKVGRPVNLNDYLLYRHCLLYKDIAKDTALINSDPSLRFYIKDETKEAEKQKKLIQERVRATSNFVELNGNPAKFNAVYIAITALNGDNVTIALSKDITAKTNSMLEFVNKNPEKFNKLVNDKNVMSRAFIETLIARGELIRAEYNQQISTAEGSFIGSNMTEAIAYFNNPANRELKAIYENKIKNF